MDRTSFRAEAWKALSQTKEAQATMPPETDIYESDPDSRPDSEFVRGCLALLVVGNTGRLLDPRRTPVTLVNVSPDRASFTVRVDAFEDVGARWELFLGEVERFQFERDSRRLPGAGLARLNGALTRFDRPLRIEADAQQREASRREIRRRRRELTDRVADLQLTKEYIDGAIEQRIGCERAVDLTQNFLAGHGLSALEQDLLGPLVSNPRSGEMLKGHAIVLAELGLCPFNGRIVRDPNLFAGSWSKASRAEHLLWRMALTQEIWSRAGEPAVYRVISSDDAIGPTSSSFVSTTLSEVVAGSHVEAGATRRVTKLIARALPLDRLFMTFLETRAMSERYREAEAVLVGTPDGAL